MSGESISAVTGVTVAAVDGESAASTAWDSELSVTIGGRTGSLFTGGLARLGASGGLFFGEEARPLLVKAAFGDGICRSPKPLKEPKDPDNVFEKLLLLLCEAEPLLDAVD